MLECLRNNAVSFLIPGRFYIWHQFLSSSRDNLWSHCTFWTTTWVGAFGTKCFASRLRNKSWSFQKLDSTASLVSFCLPFRLCFSEYGDLVNNNSNALLQQNRIHMRACLSQMGLVGQCLAADNTSLFWFDTIEATQFSESYYLWSSKSAALISLWLLNKKTSSGKVLRIEGT